MMSVLLMWARSANHKQTNNPRVGGFDICPHCTRII